MGQTISTGNNFETRSANTTPESKRKLTTTQKISLGVAAVMTAGAAVGIGMYNANHSEKSTNVPDKNPKQIEQVANTAVASEKTESSEATSEALPQVPSVESLAISAETTSAEAIARQVFSEIGSITTICSTEAVYNEYKKLNGTANIDEWSKQFAEPYIDAHLTALFGSDYSSNPDVAEIVKQLHDGTSMQLSYYLRSMIDNDPNTPTYSHSIDFIDILSDDNETGSIVAEVREYDNLQSTSVEGESMNIISKSTFSTKKVTVQDRDVLIIDKFVVAEEK